MGQIQFKYQIYFDLILVALNFLIKCIHLLWGSTHTNSCKYKPEEAFQHGFSPTKMWVRGLYLGSQAWWQVFLPTEPCREPRLVALEGT